MLTDAKVAIARVPGRQRSFAGWSVTQACARGHEHGGPVRWMRHEPLGLVSGAFKGAQLNWPTVSKEGNVIVATFHRLEYLLW